MQLRKELDEYGTIISRARRFVDLPVEDPPKDPPLCLFGPGGDYRYPYTPKSKKREVTP